VADHPLEDLSARLERERLDADRRYNEALTAVDRAIQRAPSFARQSFGDEPSGALIAPGITPPPVERSFRGRLRAFIWQVVGPYFQAQAEFNLAAAAAASRRAADARQLAEALAEAIGTIRGEFESLSRFESLLVQYLQTITAYVDTKDRSHGGPELRQRLALAEQRLAALKREIEARGLEAGAAADQGSDRAPASPVFGRRIDSATYVGFEDRFRGSQEDIRSRVAEYVPMLSRKGLSGGELKPDTIYGGSAFVVDVGCGRGELLEALRAEGVPARGIDVNHAMVELCRMRGLDAIEADALTGLLRQADESIAGLVAIQVVEHFEPAYLVRFLETAYQKMQPGAPLILETINPACWMAFFETYIRDLTHQRPLHPDTLKYLVEASGFTSVDVQYRRPVRDSDRLERVDASIAAAAGHAAVQSIAAALNAHADKLNARLFSSMDYVVVARR